MPRIFIVRLVAPILLTALLIFLFLSSRPGSADGPGAPPALAPPQPLDPEAFAALETITLAEGLQVDLFATEPLARNIVTMSADAQGRLYVVETHRRRSSAFDIRRFREWTDADLSFLTVDDRARFLRENVSEDNPYFASAIAGSSPAEAFDDFNDDGRIDWRDLEVQSERVRLLWDSTGDGRADQALTFAEDFNSMVSAIAAGVIVRKGDVWVTSAPELVRLRDTTGDGRADQRRVLLDGFGVHISYGGHDMHGLKFGPDGKLYWSIADRGTSVKHLEQLKKSFPGLTPDMLAHSGAVFRANPDGTEFELVATGLRNPQELAFDEYGDLFTGDNNADGGDLSRWTHLLEGADYGWHYGWQFLPRLGPWNSEKLWELAPDNTGAYIVPPVAHIANGPAGTTYYPGTGLAERYRNFFFLCDFKGSAAASGVYAFTLERRGASHVLTEKHPFAWNVLATDIEFGPDGNVYISDWLHGWAKPEKGRIFRVFDPEQIDSDAVRETRRLLGEGMEERTVSELGRLLGHADQRVRQEAQFELAERAAGTRAGIPVLSMFQPSGQGALRALREAAARHPELLGRLHAIWGLGQVQRASPESDALNALAALLHDPEPEVRAQAVKIAGDARHPETFAEVLNLLSDPHPRVRFFAAQSAGHYGRTEGAGLLVNLLRANADEDPAIRHAAVIALSRISDEPSLALAAQDDSRSVRLAAALTLRRLQRPEIAALLQDSDPAIVLEAARAIYDVPIPQAFGALAAHGGSGADLMRLPDGTSGGPDVRTAVLQRVIQANLRLGDAASARRLVELGAHPGCPEMLAIEALESLAAWPEPGGRDRLLGLWRPRPGGDAGIAAAALQAQMRELFGSSSDGVRAAAILAAGRLGLRAASADLHAILQEPANGAAVRTAALQALADLRDDALRLTLQERLSDPEARVREEAGRLQTKLFEEDAAETMVHALSTGTLREQQAALAALALLRAPAAEEALIEWMDRLLAGTLPETLLLDVLAAAELRGGTALQERRLRFEASRLPSDPLADFRETLHGGDFQAGREVFYNRPDLGCFRCHAIDGEGGTVGPDLAGIGARHSREYLLESIIDPGRRLPEGYAEGPSSMPPGLDQMMTRAELRDLIEFLSGLK